MITLYTKYSQLSPENDTDQLHTEADSQSQIQPQQEGTDAASQPHHLVVVRNMLFTNKEATCPFLQHINMVFKSTESL